MKTITTFDLDRLVRPEFKKFKGYSTARDEFNGTASIFLDANESPYSSLYNRYPDPHQTSLKQKLAELKCVNSDQLFLGNGSDEAIDLLIRLFCEPKRDSVIIPQPTYGMYKVCAEINAIKVITISLDANFDLDVDKTLGLADDTTKIIFLCSPNNPTGNLLNRRKVEVLLENFKGIVVVDEAYIDFANASSFVRELGHFPNLVVLQTLSKAWGLAGLRLGMCFASKQIVNLLNKIKSPYNINSATQTFVTDALSNKSLVESRVAEILAQRSILAQSLAELSVVNKVYPSDANFLLVKVSDAKYVYRSLLSNGIIVRDRSDVAMCENCLRITIGTPEENTSLINVLKSL